MGLKLRTKVKYQCDRDPKDGGLTEWRTGKRQVWINLPDKPLPKYTRVGDTQARLYHFEMKAVMVRNRETKSTEEKTRGS